MEQTPEMSEGGPSAGGALPECNQWQHSENHSPTQKLVLTQHESASAELPNTDALKLEIEEVCFKVINYYEMPIIMFCFSIEIIGHKINHF